MTKTHLSTEWHTDILLYRDASFYVVWDVWKCTCSPNYLPSYYTNTAVKSTLAVFYRMLTIIPSKDVLIISIIWHTFTRKSWIFMAKCGFFYDIFKVVVVIDESDYLHGDDIPQLSHFSHLLMDSASSIQTPLLLLLCLILLKCYV